jgi:hypothetical protein
MGRENAERQGATCPEATKEGVMLALLAGAIAALLFFLLDENAAGEHLLWGWVAAVAGGLLGWVPAFPARGQR